MAKFSGVVGLAVLAMMAGIAACTSGGNSNYMVTQPPEIDAAVDAAPAGADATPTDGSVASDAAVNVDAAVSTGADLSLSIATSSDPVAASSALTYTINVTNNGGLDAANITVTQRLPSGNISFQTATGIGWTCNAAGQIVTCTRSTLLVGAAPSIAITVTTPPIGGTITTSASVAADTRDPDSTNNQASATTTVLTPADLSIALTDAPDPVAAGGQLTYTITVTNNGPGPSSEVSVVDHLQAGVTFVSGSGTDWSCSPTGQDVTCFNASMAASTSSVITLVANAPTAGGAISNTASVSASTPDGNAANNQASTSTSVNAAADLAIAVSAPNMVPAAQTLTYTINVTDLGPRDATDLSVTSRLPDGNISLLSASGIGWTCAVAGQVVTCTRSSLLVGAAPSIFIQITTPPTNGSLVFGTSVSASTTDLALDNNAASLTTAVFDSADLSITASETPNPVRVGTNFAYALSVGNDGPTPATAIEIDDTLPEGSTFVSASGTNWTCSNSGNDVTCTMASLAANSSAQPVTIVATAPATAQSMTNTATVISSTSDPDSSNNTATTVTLANLFADLSVTLTDSPDPVQGTSNPGCSSNDCVTYTIPVANAGPDSATGITVVTQLPNNGSFFNAVGSGWVCPAPTSVLTCTRAASLASGATAPNITLVWKAPSPGGFSIIVTSTVSGNSTDPSTANNTATQDTTVLP